MKIKCSKCGNEIETSAVPKSKNRPRLMVQIEATISCPKCGEIMKLETSYGHDILQKIDT